MRILFHHIPKTAGTSISAWLSECCPELVAGHGKASLIPSMPPETLKLTVIREPVDRMLSAYFFHQGPMADTGDKLIHYFKHWQDRDHYQKLDFSQFDIVGVYENLTGFCEKVAAIAGLPSFDGRRLKAVTRVATVDTEPLREILRREIEIYDQVASGSLVNR